MPDREPSTRRNLGRLLPSSLGARLSLTVLLVGIVAVAASYAVTSAVVRSAVARTPHDVEVALAAIRLSALGNVLFAGVFAAVVGVLFARSAGRILRTVTREVREHGPELLKGGGNVPRPIEHPALPSEVRELASALDSLAPLLAERHAVLERALADAEDAQTMLRIAVQAAPEAMVVVRDGTIVLANPTASEYLHMPADDIVGRAPEEIVERVRPVREDGMPVTWEEVVSTALATPVVVKFDSEECDDLWIRVSAGEHVRGDSRWLLVSAFDVTEERRLERVRAELASMVSHDLRAPLAVVAGYLDMLGGDLGDVQRGRAYTGARTSVERMDAMLEDLLEMTRAEEFSAPRSAGPVDLASLARDVAASTAAAYPGRHVEVLAQEGVEASGEESRLRQVLTNLLTNAMKYSPADAPVIIRVEGRDGTARMSVEDGGPGIPEEDRELVFERFTRLATNRPASPGLGLGLYIVRTIVEAHGGSVSVSDAPAGGASVVVELPPAKAG